MCLFPQGRVKVRMVQCDNREEYISERGYPWVWESFVTCGVVKMTQGLIPFFYLLLNIFSMTDIHILQTPKKDMKYFEYTTLYCWRNKVSQPLEGVSDTWRSCLHLGPGQDDASGLLQKFYCKVSWPSADAHWRIWDCWCFLYWALLFLNQLCNNMVKEMALVYSTVSITRGKNNSG